MGGRDFHDRRRDVDGEKIADSTCAEDEKPKRRFSEEQQAPLA